MKAFPDRLRIALWALLLLGGHAMQVMAATHWHGTAHTVAGEATSQSPAPADKLPGHDGCLLCQVVAQTGDHAPPPAPWVLHVAHDPSALLPPAAGFIVAALRPSYAWQGRAPPQV